MKLRALAAFVGAAALTAACRKAPAPARDAEAARVPPKGDVIWLLDPAGPGEAGLEQQLARLGSAALFVPGGRVDMDSGGWTLAPDAPPPHPLNAVVLVLRAGAALSA